MYLLQGKKSDPIVLAAAYNPDMVMIGCVSGKTDPISFCKSLKNDPLLQKIPLLVIIPEKNNTTLCRQASLCGVDAFLYSPFDDIDLAMQIKTLLRICKVNISAKMAKASEKSKVENHSEEKEDANKTLQQNQHEVKNREENEAALSASEEKFKSYIENAPFGIFIVDGKGKYVDVNEFAEKMTGYKREEIIGKHILDYIFPEDYPLAQKHFQTVVEKGEASVDVRYIRKDGAIRYSAVKAVKLSEDLFLGFKSDITDRKNDEKKLKESEERYRLIAENTSDGIIVFDANNQLTYASPAYLNQFGYSEEQTLKRNKDAIYELVHPDDRDALFANIFRAIGQKKEDLVYTYRFKNGKGEYIWREDRAKFKYDKSGNYEGINVICHDITDRKHAENALLESEARFKNMFEYHDAAMLLIEPITGNIVNANRSAVKFYGYPKSELCAKNISEINVFSPDKVKDEKEKTFNNRKKYFIFSHKLSNGEIRTVEVHSSPINFQGKRVLFSIIHDVTERQQAETDLQKSKKLLSQAEEIADMGSWEYDFEKDVTLWSDGMFKILQLSPEQGAPKLAEHAAFFTIESFERLRKALKECSISGKPYEIELQSIRSDGEIRTCIGKGRAEKNQDGKIIQLWGTLNDITERKRAEKAIHDIAIAKQTVKFKQNFLANMSHEIRTPLTGVLGMIDALEDTKLTENQKDFVNTIKLSGENLKEIIDQVLDYSKIEAGKLTLKPSAFDLRSVPETAKMLFKNNIKKGVDISIQIQDKIPAYIRADKYRLSQIVNNLVSNAVKFTSEGQIEIRTSLVETPDETNDITIKIEVEDTGIGIPPEMEKNLFLPFSQIEEIDTIYHEGTGLGLSICKQCVKMMDGEIGMISKPSGGSIFWFTFHAGIAEVPLEKKYNSSKNTLPTNLKILLAEDKVVNQKVVKLMLTNLGNTVSIVNNGQEALDIYQPDTFDLILMDIQMPVMNGVAATQKLKEKYNDLPPVVGLSANAFEGDREKYMKLGMDEYLTKPVKKADFEKLISKIIHSPLERLRPSPER
ncbi:MAG: PAS domain S-box protein [Bacteroidota bacterium]